MMLLSVSQARSQIIFARGASRSMVEAVAGPSPHFSENVRDTQEGVNNIYELCIIQRRKGVDK